MDIGSLLAQAWAIVRRHKALWLFGFLAALGTGSSYGLSFNKGDVAGSGGMPDIVERIPPEQLAAIAGLACVVGLAAILFVVILSTMGQAGLIRGAGLADAGAMSLPVGMLWSEAVPYFWPVLFFNIAVLVLAIVAGIAIAAFVVVGIITIIGLLCLPLLCLLIPVAFVASCWVELARVAVVNDGVDVPEGFRRGWVTVRGHLGDVLLTGIVLMVLLFCIGILLLIPFALVFFPVGMAIGMGSGVAQSAGIMMAIAGACILVPIAIIIHSILQAFTTTTWTLLYRRLTSTVASTSELLPPPPDEQAYPVVTA